MQIIHKDFRPSNLLVSGMADNIKVKLSDFDDLFILKNTTTATQTNINTLVGCTLMYTAHQICQQIVVSPSFETKCIHGQYRLLKLWLVSQHHGQVFCP